MRLILILWMIPLVVFWGWYGLSASDINFGTFIFSRQCHDLMFRIYGSFLGVPPQEVPLLIAGTFLFDTMLLLVLAAFRWRKSWYPKAKIWVMEYLAIEPTDEITDEEFENEMGNFSFVEETNFSTSAEYRSNRTERSTYPMHLAE